MSNNKNLIVTSISETKHGISSIYSNAINCPPEKWSMTVKCREEDCRTDRELALITITMPNGSKLSGNIQSFQAIEAVMRNARENLIDFAEMPFTSKEDEADVLDSIGELDSVIAMFQK